MATCAAWPAPPGAKPNRGDARRFSVEESLDLSPDRCPGWLLEAAGNGRPRGMAIARAKPRAIQNPAYRPAGTALRTPGDVATKKAGLPPEKAGIAADFAPVEHVLKKSCATIRTCPTSFDFELRPYR